MIAAAVAVSLSAAPTPARSSGLTVATFEPPYARDVATSSLALGAPCDARAFGPSVRPLDPATGHIGRVAGVAATSCAYYRTAAEHRWRIGEIPAALRGLPATVEVTLEVRRTRLLSLDGRASRSARIGLTLEGDWNLLTIRWLRGRLETAGALRGRDGRAVTLRARTKRLPDRLVARITSSAFLQRGGGAIAATLEARLASVRVIVEP